MKRIATALCLSLAFFPLSSMAQEGGYLGLGAGITRVDIDANDWNDGSITSGSVDDSDTGFKLFGGYKANENFAFEVAYVNLGETTFSGESDGSSILFCPGAVDGSAEVTTFSFMGVGMLPVNRNLSLHGKFGMHLWDADVAMSDTCYRYSGNDDGTDLMFGFGATFYAADQFGVRLEWERYTEIFEVDVDFISLSGLVRF